MAPCWYSQLLYSNLLATSVIIETPTREEAEKNGAGAGNAREVPLPDQAYAIKMAGYWPSSFFAYSMNSQRR